MFPIYIKDFDFEPPDDPIYYLVSGNGIFLVKTHPPFQSRTLVENIPWLPGEEPEFRFRGPKLARVLMAQSLAFFFGVWERHKTESIVIIHFRPQTRTYGIEVPMQTVGGIHCLYEEPLGQRLHDELRVGTIHSHGREDAFHSDKDNTDEAHQDGLHLIFGNLDTVPTLLCSAMVDGKRFPLRPEEIVEGLPSREDLVPWRGWVEQEIARRVKPLKKPIQFGT